MENFDTIFVEHGDISLAGGGGTAFISQSGSVGVEAIGAAKVLATLPVPEGNRTAIISPAGGYGVMGADHVEFKKKGIGYDDAEIP